MKHFHFLQQIYLRTLCIRLRQQPKGKRPFHTHLHKYQLLTSRRHCVRFQAKEKKRKLLLLSIIVQSAKCMLYRKERKVLKVIRLTQEKTNHSVETMLSSFQLSQTSQVFLFFCFVFCLSFRLDFCDNSECFWPNGGKISACLLYFLLIRHSIMPNLSELTSCSVHARPLAKVKRNSSIDTHIFVVSARVGIDNQT